jgi:hypothetical protein
VRTCPSAQTWAARIVIVIGSRRARAVVLTRSSQPSPRTVTAPGRPGSPSKSASSFGSAQLPRPPATLAAESTAMNAMWLSIGAPRSMTAAPKTSLYGPAGPSR